VRDPGNLGTILRIADWYGLDQILCSPDCVEVYNQKVIQSSMGAVFRIPARILSLPELAEQTKSSGTQLSAALLEGKDIRHSKPDASGVIMMGNESKGLSPEAIALCDQRLTIARIGEAESLNVAIATGIFAQWFSSN